MMWECTHLCMLSYPATGNAQVKLCLAMLPIASPGKLGSDASGKASSVQLGPNQIRGPKPYLQFIPDRMRQLVTDKRSQYF